MCEDYNKKRKNTHPSVKDALVGLEKGNADQACSSSSTMYSRSIKRIVDPPADQQAAERKIAVASSTEHNEDREVWRT